MNYCTNYCDSKRLLQRHPLRIPPPSPNSQIVQESRNNSGKCKVLIFLRVWSFHSHALCILCPPTIWRRFLWDSVEIAPFVGGRHIQSMRVKRSDLKKIRTLHLPFGSKLLPAVLLLLRIYFPPQSTVTVTVLKFGWIYHCRYRLGPRSRPFISIDFQLLSWKSFELIFSKLPLPLPSWNAFELER